MENQRLFLIIGIAFVGLMLFNKWNELQNRPDTKPKIEKSGKPDLSTSKTDKPSLANSKKSEIKPDSTDTTKKTSTTETNTEPKRSQSSRPTLVKADKLEVKSKERIKVETDVFQIEIDTLGAEVHKLGLKKYTISVKDRTPFRLMDAKGNRMFVTESGFVMSKGQDHMAPTSPSNSVYTTPKKSYKLEGGKNKLEVKFYWESKNNVQVVKTYTFYRGRHDIHVNTVVNNNSNIEWTGRLYQQLNRSHYADSGQNMFLPTYMGGAIHSKARGYEKVTFVSMKDKDLEKRSGAGGNLYSVKNGWIAMVQQDFVTAFIPSKKNRYNIYSSTYTTGENLVYSLGIQWFPTSIKPNKSLEYQSVLYAGAKKQEVLEKLGDELDLVVDYGILGLISKPLYWILTFFYSIINNWGVAIILLTITVKALFYRLSAASYRSMAKMRKLSPRMKQLKERHGDNRQAYTLAIQEMFKKEKVNPLGGCLPILVQIPVFIALYWVLLESVELRQAPFIFWIQDLSIKDPFFILPLLMGATMFLQHKLNPPQLDPMQQKIMMALPIVFTVFFMMFPAGLVLYWLVNNILSIAQQWYITKQITGEEHLFAKQD